MSLGLILKKLFARLFFPLPLTILLLAAGIFLLYPRTVSRRRKTAGITLVSVAAGLLLAGGIFGDLLLKPLTNYYLPLDPATLPAGETYTVAVAGSAYFNAPGIPAQYRFNDRQMLRMSEAAMLCKALEQRNISCRIAVSLPDFHSPSSQRMEALQTYFGSFGIPPEKLLLIETAQNTRQELREFGKLPGKLLLVSEAFHMPRIMSYAKKYGIDALPAPIGHLNPASRLDPLSFIPDGRRFYSFQTAVYELLGILESKLF